MLKIERHIINFHPINYIVEKSKNIKLPGFEGAPLYDVVNFFKKQLKTSRLTERASAISFNFIMSLPPTCLFLFTLIPNLPFVSKKGLRTQIHVFIDSVTPAKAHNHLMLDFIDRLIKSSNVSYLSFGLLLALFFASNGVMGLMRSFDREYIGFQKRRALKKRWVAIKLTFLLYILFFFCILLMISHSKVLKWIGVKNEIVREIITYGRWVPIIALLFYSFAFIYKYAPATKKRWKLFSPGAVFATFFSILVYWLFSAFVNSFGTYNLLYGSLGTIIVVMILVFLNSLAILMGFELNVSIKTLKAMAEQRKSEEEK